MKESIQTFTAQLVLRATLLVIKRLPKRLRRYIQDGKTLRPQTLRAYTLAILALVTLFFTAQTLLLLRIWRGAVPHVEEDVREGSQRLQLVDPDTHVAFNERQLLHEQPHQRVAKSLLGDFNGQYYRRSRTSCRIAFLTSWVPRKCGIASVTSQLVEQIELHGCEAHIIALDDAKTSKMGQKDGRSAYWQDSRVIYHFDPLREGRLNIKNQNSHWYRAFKKVQEGHYNALIVEHEFSLYLQYGTELPDMFTEFRQWERNTTDSNGNPQWITPIMTVLHNPMFIPHQFQLHLIKIINKMVHAADRGIALSRRSIVTLQRVFGVDPAHVDFINNGAIDVPYSFETKRFKRMLALPEDRPIIMTFGILHAFKGVDTAIRSLPAIKKKYPNVLYILLGHIDKKDPSRSVLKDLYTKLAQELDVSENVMFLQEYVTDEVLNMYLRATDIYLTPYEDYTPVSGTVTFAMALSRPVVTTDYIYAREIMLDGGNSGTAPSPAKKRGLVVPIGDAEKMSGAILELLENESLRREISEEAYRYIVKNLHWRKVAMDYLCSIDTISRELGGTVESRQRVLTSDVDRQQCQPNNGLLYASGQEHMTSTKVASIDTLGVMHGFNQQLVPLSFVLRDITSQKNVVDALAVGGRGAWYALFITPFVRIDAKLEHASGEKLKQMRERAKALGEFFDRPKLKPVDKDEKDSSYLDETLVITQLRARVWAGMKPRELLLEISADRDGVAVTLDGHVQTKAEVGTLRCDGFRVRVDKPQKSTDASGIAIQRVVIEDTDVLAEIVIVLLPGKQGVAWIELPRVLVKNDFVNVNGLLGQTGRYIHPYQIKTMNTMNKLNADHYRLKRIPKNVAPCGWFKRLLGGCPQDQQSELEPADMPPFYEFARDIYGMIYNSTTEVGIPRRLFFTERDKKEAEEACGIEAVKAGSSLFL